MKRNISAVLDQTAQAFSVASHAVQAFSAYSRDLPDEGYVQTCLAALEEKRVKYDTTDNDRRVLVRVIGLPRVEYFPLKNRWRVAGCTKRHHGSVEKLIEWIMETVR